jgi:microcystin-dependent protein
MLYIIVLIIIFIMFAYILLKNHMKNTESLSMEGFDTNLMQILPIWISPDNQQIKVPNYIEGNKKEEITFASNINLQGDTLKIKGIPNSTPVGVIVSFLGERDPDGWVICDGQPRTYDVKYESLLTSNIGSRNGSQYFPPNLTDRFLKHTEVKKTNNAPTVTLTTSNLPNHTHAGTTSSIATGPTSHTHGVNDPGHSHEYSKAWHKMPQSGRSTWCLTDFINDRTRPSTTGISIQGTDTNHTHNLNIIPTGGGEKFPIPDPLFYGVKFMVKY